MTAKIISAPSIPECRFRQCWTLLSTSAMTRVKLKMIRTTKLKIRPDFKCEYVTCYICYMELLSRRRWKAASAQVVGCCVYNLRLIQTCIKCMHLCSKIENFLTDHVLCVHKNWPILLRFTQSVWMSLYWKLQHSIYI